MMFLQPYMLWGMLAVVMPVALHFWYQKKGKTIEWAAMRWLGEQTTLQHRGLRLNEVWLMLLRCLLVALIVLILSKPVPEWLKGVAQPEVVHLIQPDRLVTETYRFELETALKKGEKAYWAGITPETVGALNELPASGQGLAHLQQNINALAMGKEGVFKLYFKNDLSPDEFPRVYVPGDYQLFPATDSTQNKPFELNKTALAARTPVRILLDYRDADEEKTVTAALNALAEVYGFNFELEKQKNPEKRYDWVFTNQPVADPMPETMYIVSGNILHWGAPLNVVQLRDSLDVTGSELVESGRFPEWLGDLIVKRMKFKADGPFLSKGQLHALFTKILATNAQSEANLRPWLLLILVCLMITERWLALRKPAGKHG